MKRWAAEVEIGVEGAASAGRAMAARPAKTAVNPAVSKAIPPRARAGPVAAISTDSASHRTPR